MIQRLSRPIKTTLLLLAALYALYLAWELTPLEIWAQQLISWMQSLGVTAYIVYTFIYLLATLLVIPLTPLTVGAGFAFGFTTALPLTLVAATIGAVAAFLLSRCVARQRFHDLVNRSARLSAVEASVTDKGWRIVLLLRFSPVVPSHILNYLCGVTGISFLGYAAATFFGKIPVVALFSYVGATTAGTVQGGDSITSAHFMISIFGLIATILACWLVARDARRRLHQQGFGHE
jgi:uncharacterized membrane protein YdjX (TVP38/TMEM64 family)